MIEAICAAEDRQKAEERDAWHRYEEASIALLTTKPTTMAGVIAIMNYVALPECSGPGVCETILDGARLSSNRELPPLRSGSRPRVPRYSRKLR